MKKIFFLAMLLLGLFMIIVAAGFRNIPGLLETSLRPQNCTGYTIIEFNKGVNCNGDTINLVRRNGFAERVKSTIGETR